MPSAVSAQHTIKTVIVDSITRIPLPGANAIVFSTDSSFIKGTTSDTAGVVKFNLSPHSPYILRISMIGYKSLFFNIPKTKRGNGTFPSDTLLLPLNEVALKVATVVGTRADMETKEDTTSFSAEEYKVPEGEALEELVKLLPGVEIDGNTITYNGKPISEFKVNGKDFFKGNSRSAIKNLPVELVNRIKTY